MWELDHTIYRAIHVELRRDWLDPFVVILSQTGLGHVQFATLLLACLPHRRRWISPVLATMLILCSLAVPQWRDALTFQLFVNGFALAIFGMAVVSFIPLSLARFAAPPLIAGVLAGLVRLGLMRLVDRQRPSNLAIADPLEHAFANTSFPSGHATTTFAIAFSIMLLTHRTDAAWLGRWALTWAVLIGLSRIYIGVHWPSDIIGGAALGLACATVVHMWWIRRQDTVEQPQASS